MSSKPKADAKASARFSTSNTLPSDVMSTTESLANAIKANPAYGSHPEIQQGLTAWLSTATTVDTDSQKLQALHLALTALSTSVVNDMVAWRRAGRALVALINTASAGSAQAITQWGYATTDRVVTVPTLDAPTGLRVSYSRQLVLTVRWNGVPDHVGYQLEIGDGTPTGWGSPITCPRASYQPTGLTPGQKVALRVAVVRKNGLSNWSDALTITAR